MIGGCKAKRSMVRGLTCFCVITSLIQTFLILSGREYAKFEIGTQIKLDHLHQEEQGSMIATSQASTCEIILSACPYVKQISLDLLPFRVMGGINSALLQSAVDAMPKRVVVLYIRQNRFFVEKNAVVTKEYWRGMVGVLVKLSCLVEFPNADLVMYPGDTFPENMPILPIFSWSKRLTGPGILLPYWSFLHDLTAFQLEAFQRYNFSTKISKMVWRGSSTGGWYNDSNWHSFPRSRIVVKCSQEYMKDICDALFTQIIQADSSTRDSMIKNLSLGDPLTLLDQMQYKYIACPDGNGPATRMLHLLFGNSLIMKEESDQIEFYYHGLRPDVHYVSLAPDMSNLEEKLRLVISDDEATSEKVNAMIEYSRSLSMQHVACYVMTLLNEYVEITDFVLEPLDKLIPRVVGILPGHNYHDSVVPSSCNNPIYACQNYTVGENDDWMLLFQPADAKQSSLCNTWNNLEGSFRH